MTEPDLTIKEAYNKAASVYRKKYERHDARAEDIDQALSYVGVKYPKVLEIGCAYGRDAVYVLTKTPHYVGIDICDEFIEMAKQEIEGGEFYCADVLEYDFPKNLDAIFSFASLLHLSKEEMSEIFGKVSAALVPGGVFFLSLKRRAEYQTAIDTDEVVSRRFYYYTRETLSDIAPSDLKEVFYSEQERAEDWLTIIFQKH